MAEVDHFTLTEATHTTSVLPRLEGDTGSDREPCREGGASSKLTDQLPSESGEITRFKAGGNVTGLCLYNKTIFLVKYDVALYMYSSSGDLKKRHVVDGMKTSWDVTVMTQEHGDKLIITSHDPRCLYYLPVKCAGDTCTLGTTHSKQLNYLPWGLV